MTGIEQQIIDIIQCEYDCIYEGDLKFTKTDNYYKLVLYLQGQPHAFGGTVIANQCDSDEQFLKYVREELRKNRRDLASYGQLRIYGNIETQEGI